MSFQLYSYFRSSTAYRVRIALHLKGIPFETIPVNILKGEQGDSEYRKLNPMMGVPTLVHDGFALSQSLAILNYLDNVVPTPPLADGNYQELAYVRQVALSVAMEIHPLINLKVLNHIAAEYGADDGGKKEWYGHWACKGMGEVEALLRNRGWHGDFALKDQVSVADLCIVPQMYSLRRYNIDVSEYPICCKIEANCMSMDAFQKASPEMQPDAPSDLVPIHGPNFKAA